MASLESVFNHLVLPTKLPDQQDPDPEAVSKAIFARLLSACEALGQVDGYVSVERALRRCQGIAEARLEAEILLREWSDLRPGDLIILRIAAQNAALLIRRGFEQDSATAVFEVFETSPLGKDVLSADNALTWEFPGRAVEIPLEKFHNSSFRNNLASVLEQAAQEALPRFEVRAVKAGVSVVERRDPADPAFISQVLMSLLEGIGKSLDVPRLSKNVRDDAVVYKALLPWRRDPSWLVLRVATQRQLCLALGVNCGQATYKFLICAMLSRLLDDCTGKLSPDLTVLLRAKLCRRLAKLQRAKSQASENASVLYERLFYLVGKQCQDSINRATEQVEAAWDRFKRANTRHIPLLPSKVDEQSLQLSLSRSGAYLENLFGSLPATRTNRFTLGLPPLGDGTIKQVKNLAKLCFKLAKLEMDTEDEQSAETLSTVSCRRRCVELAQSICSLFSSVGDAYASKPDHMSLHTQNFELWVCMDKHAVKACPLLGEYDHPLFRPEPLDVLRLPRLADMRRLRDVQRYLRERCKDCELSSKTVFSEPSKDGFASRYMAEPGEDSQRLQQLQSRVEHDSSTSRLAKRAEWNSICSEYDELSEKIAGQTCVCTFNSDTSRNINGCEKCYHRRYRNRLHISVHEDFLPADAAPKSTVIFELGVPEFFQAYRNATWKIFCELGQPVKPSNSRSVRMLLDSYSNLRKYTQPATNGISLASHAKSFLGTHYKGYNMKIDLASVVLPLGLRFSYYDGASERWVEDFKDPATFQHLCGLNIPLPLLNAGVERPRHPTRWDGPSSYNTIASQTKCPPEMSVHEFMALQRLLAGKHRRWITMLVELGSSNVNFSAEDTMCVFGQLAVQAGPAWVNSEDVLRDVHIVFRDALFCQRLSEQIEKRLRAIEASWRETHCMELLITLALRLHALTEGAASHEAERLLKIARVATLQWIQRLRKELRNATDTDMAMRSAQYGFRASLLCRRTFDIFIYTGQKMDGEELEIFVEASVALQQNLIIDPTKLPPDLEGMLMRDMKMAYLIRSVIRDAIGAHPERLGTAIRASWAQSSNSLPQDAWEWIFLPSPYQSWVVSVIDPKEDNWTGKQTVHFDILEGHLLINGEPLGRLPLEITQSEDVKKLFGNKHMQTFPSALRGMSYMLATSVGDHEVHFGYRKGRVIIRTSSSGGLFEYVPGRVFRGEGADFDLPASLIDDCAHWFNLKSGKIEIRRQPWKSGKSNWILDVKAGRARRRDSFLVDPRSDACQTINRIFRNFEKPQHLTVFQPIKGTLSVELKRLELSFSVNNKNLLYSQKLNAEIDPNQDAGTLYGLDSKIVLRNRSDRSRRSIIIGLGELSYQRRGMHVAVRAESADRYGKFEIDNVLGRLSCPPEPLLLYFKALFHAFTSFVLPDRLTGRTGTEEAYQILTSGCCQPWMPLNLVQQTILKTIRSLSPTREYYPPEKKILQTVQWNKHLTTTIQHGCYERLIDDIMRKSHDLELFDVRKQEGIKAKVQQTSNLLQLRHRSEIRQGLYERGRGPSTEETGHLCEKVWVYESRDRHSNSFLAKTVYQTVKLLHRRPFAVPKVLNLVRDLETFPGDLIGGFCDTPEHLSTACLGTQMECEIGEQWGSLVNFCRGTDSADIYDVFFRLALLSSGAKANMDTIMALAAMSTLDELKCLPPPTCALFRSFKFRESPTLEHLEKLIDVESLIAEESEYEAVRIKSWQTKMRNEAKDFAKYLLKQWPSPEPATEGFQFAIQAW